MNSSTVLALLERFGAIITNDHIVYTSGRHGDMYINKDAIYPHTEIVFSLCRELANRFLEEPADVVVAPAQGGIILSQWVARHLSVMLKRDVLAVYAEKSADGTTFVLRRGYDNLVADKRVLVVEDILTTGGSVRKVVELVRKHGGDVFGVGALVNRGGVTTRDVGNVLDLVSLLKLDLDTWSEEQCPLCQKGTPINTNVGKGLEFMERKYARSRWTCDGCETEMTPSTSEKRPNKLLCSRCIGEAGDSFG
ncbi:MAG: phosphoribosyltransferase family protein [Patescibacteria group bacterium]